MFDEFESIHCLFISFILVIVYFVWKSTEVRRETQPFENIHAFGVRRSDSLLSNASSTTSNSTTIEDNLTSSVEELAQNIFTEASESFNALNDEIDQGIAAGEEQEGDEDTSEQERIISVMDRDINPPQQQPESSDLRSRRTAAALAINDSNNETTTAPVAATILPESDSNIQMIKQDEEDDKISIKLKYLNDEIKTVECFLNESLGNFKKRNFKTELESKLIKLIFNGKLLEDDKKSMQQFGIFSEAVVHCLVLQKKNQVNANGGGAVNQNANANRRNDGSSFINSINFEWNIIGMILVCVTLVICWYCRLQYAYFSWYSTIGLILLTSLFIVLIPLFTRVFS